jgi:predicted enzyme related to lactoylglutathione lyase
MGLMSIRTSPWPAGTPCWADLMVPDADQARAFYAAVLGWTFGEPDAEHGNYSIATVDGHAVAAVSGPPAAGEQSPAWMVYFAVEDADATAARISASGGTVVFGPTDVDTFGRMCVAVDPTSATFGLWQANDFIGAQLVNDPGGLTWEDLRSADPPTAQKFYADVFGFDTRPIEMAPGDYRTFHHAGDDAPLGGMGGFMGIASHSHWVLYFAVPSTDDAIAAAERSGGSVGVPAHDTPFGRMAGLVDPAGAAFHVIQAGATEQPDRSG